MRPQPGFVVAATLVAELAAGSCLIAGGAPLAIPYRSGRPVVDGDPTDWPPTAARITITRPLAIGEPAARAAVALAWDRLALWVLFTVTDPTPTQAPAEVAGAALFQWDSVEVYLDGRGDRSDRMAEDDFQILIAPDGRYAVLQGDSLLAEVERLSVPKRERPAIALTTAGQRTADGYVVECAIPFAALGIRPGQGTLLAIDLAVNDWLADHPLAGQLRYDLESLRKLDRGPDALATRYTQHGLTAEQETLEIERRLYRPWALSGSGDLGYPQRWREAALGGGPGLAERFVVALGPVWTLAGGAATTVLLVALGLVAEHRRQRRRIGALLERLARLEHLAVRPQDSPPATQASTTVSDRRRTSGISDPLTWLEHAADHAPAETGQESLELRAVRVIHRRIEESLAPAALAATLYVSLRTLQRHLADTLRCTPSELILAVKMREARRLLAGGALQVQQAAHMVGFDDPGHFSRRFKAYFGVSPAQIQAAAAARCSTAA